MSLCSRASCWSCPICRKASVVGRKTVSAVAEAKVDAKVGPRMAECKPAVGQRSFKCPVSGSTEWNSCRRAEMTSASLSIPSDRKKGKRRCKSRRNLSVADGWMRGDCGHHNRMHSWGIDCAAGRIFPLSLLHTDCLPGWLNDPAVLKNPMCQSPNTSPNDDPNWRWQGQPNKKT